MKPQLLNSDATGAHFQSEARALARGTGVNRASEGWDGLLPKPYINPKPLNPQTLNRKRRTGASRAEALVLSGGTPKRLWVSSTSSIISWPSVSLKALAAPGCPTKVTPRQDLTVSSRKKASLARNLLEILSNA